MNHKEYIQQLIAKGNLAEAIAQFMKGTQTSGQDDLYNSLIHISGRYNSNEADYNKDITSIADYRLERARIINALTHFLEDYKPLIEVTPEMRDKLSTATTYQNPQADRVCAVLNHTTLLYDLKQYSGSNLIILPSDNINHYPEAATIHIAHKLGREWKPINVKAKNGLLKTAELQELLKEAMGATKLACFGDMCQTIDKKQVVVGQKIYVEQMNLSEAKQLIKEYLEMLGNWNDADKKLVLHIVGIPQDIKDKKKWRYFGKIIPCFMQWNEEIKNTFLNGNIKQKTALFNPLQMVTPDDVDVFLSNMDLPADCFTIDKNCYFKIVSKGLKELYINKMNLKYSLAV